MKQEDGTIARSTVTVNVDTVPPTVTDLRIFADSDNARIVISATDEGSGVLDYSLAQTSGEERLTITNNGDGTFTIEGMAPGATYSFNITVRDKAGHTTQLPMNITAAKLPMLPLIGEIVKGQAAFEKKPAVKLPTLVVRNGADMKDSAMLRYAKVNTDKKNTIMYQVNLVDENGVELELPGACILCFPYPEGMDENSANRFKFTIHHYSSKGTETFSTKDGTIVLPSQGLCIRISSFSPFEITWEEVPVVDLPWTGDNGQLALWLAMLGMAGSAMFMLRKRAYK